MLVPHRIAGLLSLWLALSSCDPSPFDESSERRREDASTGGKGGAGGRDGGVKREQNRQPPPSGADASIDAGGGEAGAGGQGGSSGSDGGAGGIAGAQAGASGSAGSEAVACQRDDTAAPVSVRGMQDLGSVAQPQSVALRIPGPISWIGGKLLWLFPKSIRTSGSVGADAAPNQPNAALLMGSDPTKLEEDLDPDGAPRRFLTADDENPSVELWPTALLRLPPPENEDTTKGVVFVQRVNPNLSYEVWVARVARNSTSAQEPLTPLFTGTDGKFSIGGFRGNGYAYLFACEEDMSVAERSDPKHFPCRIARAKSAEIEQRDAYRVYDPNTKEWVADLSAGAPVIFGPGNLLSLSFNNYLGRYLAVYSRWFSNAAVVQSAEFPWGPWREEFTISLPEPADNVALAALEQSALTPAADCATSIWISYLSPTASTNGFPSAGEIKLIKVDIE